MAEQIVPAVSPEDLAKAEAALGKDATAAVQVITAQVAHNGLNVRADVVALRGDVARVEQAIRAKVKLDHSAIVAAALHIAVLLVMALAMKLPAKDVAELGSIVAAGSAYFVAKPK